MFKTFKKEITLESKMDYRTELRSRILELEREISGAPVLTPKDTELIDDLLQFMMDNTEFPQYLEEELTLASDLFDGKYTASYLLFEADVSPHVLNVAVIRYICFEKGWGFDIDLLGNIEEYGTRYNRYILQLPEPHTMIKTGWWNKEFRESKGL